MFCFTGIEKSKVLEYFSNFDIYPGDYYYNKGSLLISIYIDYETNGIVSPSIPPPPEVLAKMKVIAMCGTGSGTEIKLWFNKVENSYTFTGALSDSTKLEDCLLAEKK